jgi:ATP-dependent Clp protease ATP-binding subunit ClpA
LEAGDQVFFPYLTLKKTVQLTDDYMKAEVFPEKALNILAEAVMLAKQQKLTTVPTGIVEAAISQRTGIPIGQAGADDRKRLLNLETELKSRVVEQDEALTVIAKAMRRNRAKVGSVNRPMGVFLFLGPTGVGKTATAKALAEVCFREEKLMRFDMAEYQTNESVIRLIGSFENKQIGLMAEQILSSPYGLLLLDEFEKAPRQVHNIFLTIFDEGYFTTADGRKIDCTNLIIIATSNAGSEKLRELINAGNTDIENTMTDYLLSQNMFSPELLNRFDALVYFKPLSHQGLVNVAMMMLKEIQDQMEKRSHVSIKFAPGLAAKIIDEGYSPDFGARSIRRYIQDEITDQIAKKLLENPDTKVVEI